MPRCMATLDTSRSQSLEMGLIFSTLQLKKSACFLVAGSLWVVCCQGRGRGRWPSILGGVRASLAQLFEGQLGAALLEGRNMVGPGRELPNVSAGDEVGLAFSVPTSIASFSSDISPEANKVPRNQVTCLKSQKC